MNRNSYFSLEDYDEDYILEFQSKNNIYYCMECGEWVEDLPRKHVCEPLRLLVEKGI